MIMKEKRKGLPLWADLIIWLILSFFAFVISEEATTALLPDTDRDTSTAF